MHDQGPVAIFWDYENCAPPSGYPAYNVIRNIRNKAQQYGSVKQFRAYVDISETGSTKSSLFYSELQACGVSLLHCPHSGRKDVADKMMIVDMFTFAIDTPPPATIIIITGDRDFVYAVSTLGLRLYRVVVITPYTAHISLTRQAAEIVDWESEILERNRLRQVAFDSPRHNPKNSDVEVPHTPNEQNNLQPNTPRQRRRASLRGAATPDTTTVALQAAKMDVPSSTDQMAGQLVEITTELSPINYVKPRYPLLAYDLSPGSRMVTQAIGSPETQQTRNKFTTNEGLSLPPITAQGSPSEVSTILTETIDNIHHDEPITTRSATPRSSRSRSIFPPLVQLGKPTYQSLPSPKKSPGFDFEPITRPTSAEPDLSPSFNKQYVHVSGLTLTDEPLPISSRNVGVNMIYPKTDVARHSLGVQTASPQQQPDANAPFENSRGPRPAFEFAGAAGAENSASLEPNLNIPREFQLLVALMDHYRAQGIVRPLRSVLAPALVGLDRKIYDKAGKASGGQVKFNWYSKEAERLGFIDLADSQGNASAMLRKEWHGKGIALDIITFDGRRPYLTGRGLTLVREN